MTEPDSLLNWDKLGALGLLITGFVGVIKGWLVPGIYYSDLKKANEKLSIENEQLRKALIGAVGTAEKLTESPK